MTFYRGACTDPNFNDPACGKYCLDVQNDIEAVWVCGNGRKYACQNISNCDDSYTRLTLDAGTLLPNAVAQKAFNSTASSASAKSTSGSSCPSHIGAYAGIGAGLGVPLLIALVLLGFLFYKNKKLRKTHASSRNMVSEIPQGGISYMNQQPKPYADRPVRASPAPAYNASRHELGPNSTM